MTIFTRVESVLVEDVRRNRKAMEQQCMQAWEAAALRDRPAQTVAGFVAVKLALVRACSELFPATECRERSFELAHAPSGAPLLVSSPVPSDFSDSVRVSVSHTKALARGLVVIIEG